MKKYIQNRKGEKISVVIEGEKHTSGLAFVIHGLSGNKDEAHIRIFVQAFLDNDITVVSFDTTNTFGESDGKFENATLTNYYEDLEDVVSWSENESFYREKFYVAGHSLGGICTALYAQKYPNKIQGLAPISSVVSGKLSVELGNRDINKWKELGYVIEKSNVSPDGFKKLNYNHIVDRLKYDLLENIDVLNMPILMIVGDKDTSTPLSHQQILFDSITSEKEFHIIKGAPHTFITQDHLQQIYNIFNNWIKKYHS